MTVRSHASGPSFTSALVSAVADLADCDEAKVDLRLSAPGIDELAGSFHIELEVRSEREAGPDEAESGGGRDRSDDGDEAPTGELTPEDLDEEADAAADFLEGLLDAMDLPGDLRIRIHDDHAELEVVEIGSGALIGRRGQTLEAIQELVRCVLQRRFQRRARVKIDAEGYRARRMEKLIEKTEEAIDTVLDTGDAERLEPMDVFERKAVHQLVAEVDGVTSRSQGREPARRVIIELD